MRISDWSSDVCSSDLGVQRVEVIGDAGRGGDLRVVGTRRCQLLQKAVRIEEVRLVRQALGEGAPGHHEALVRPVGLVEREEVDVGAQRRYEIGRASCRERVGQYV